MPPKDSAQNEPSVAPKFSSAMNAATSRFGVLCDIPITFVAVALFGIIAAGIYGVFPNLHFALAGVMVGAPIVVCAAAHVALRNARNEVVAWMRALPFPIENLNAVLSGSGEYFEVFLRDDPPPREAVMEYLERASDGVFVMEQDAERKVISARFGVMDSKLNPYRSAHQRYVTMRKVVDLSLVPMHEAHPIERVLIV